jgi:hypothetical protein
MTILSIQLLIQPYRVASGGAGFFPNETNMRPVRTALPTLVALLLGACHETSAPPARAPVDAGETKPADGLEAAAEVEPNDGPDNAQAIARPTRVKATLHPVQPATRPDEDWYVIKPQRVPADAQLALSGFAGGRLGVELYDRDHNKILALSAQPGQGLALPAMRVRDSLFVRVYAQAGGSGAYEMTVRLSEPDPNAEAEPNDRPADATPLALDQTLHATLSTAQDQDWYRVELNPNGGHGATDGGLALPSPGAVQGGALPPRVSPSGSGGDAATAAPATAPNPLSSGGSAGAAPVAQPALMRNPSALLRISLSTIEGVRSQLSVFDQNQLPLAVFRAGKIGMEIDVRDLALSQETTAVYLMVTGSPHDPRGVDAPPYQIAVHREPAPPDFEIEPNDTMPQATPIATRRSGFLSPKGDVDYYLLHLAGPSVLHAVLSPLDHVDTELAVVDAADNGKEHVLIRANEGGPKEAEVIPALVLPAGDHLIRIQAASHQVGDKWVRDQENPDDPYTLTLSLSADEGGFEREPNDRTDQATPIKIGQTLSGYAYPAKDVDIYQLDLSAQPVGMGVVVRLTGVSRVPLALELRGPPTGLKQGGLLNTSDLGKAGAKEEIRAKLDPGIYQIVVRPHPVSRAPGQPLADPDTPYQLSVQSE